MFHSFLFRQVSEGVGQDFVQLGLAAHRLADQHDAVLNVDHFVKLENYFLLVKRSILLTNLATKVTAVNCLLYRPLRPYLQQFVS
jgi:hypothetical protein